MPAGSLLRPPCNLEAELGERPGVELIDHFADVAVHLARAGFTQLVAAEATGLHADAADSSSPCCLHIPHAVTDSQGTTRIDGKPLHSAEEDFRVRLGAFDIIGGGLTVYGIVGVERVAQRDELIVGRRSGKHHDQASFVDLSQGFSGAGKGEDIAGEFLVAQRSPRLRLGAVMTDEFGDELISAHADRSG